MSFYLNKLPFENLDIRNIEYDQENEQYFYKTNELLDGHLMDKALRRPEFQEEQYDVGKFRRGLTGRESLRFEVLKETDSQEIEKIIKFKPWQQKNRVFLGSQVFEDDKLRPKAELGLEIMSKYLETRDRRETEHEIGDYIDQSGLAEHVTGFSYDPLEDRTSIRFDQHLDASEISSVLEKQDFETQIHEYAVGKGINVPELRGGLEIDTNPEYGVHNLLNGESELRMYGQIIEDGEPAYKAVEGTFELLETYFKHLN